MSDCVYVGLDSVDIGRQQKNTHSVVCYLLPEITNTNVQTLGDRVAHSTKVLTVFNDGFSKVFQGPFGYGHRTGGSHVKLIKLEAFKLLICIVHLFLLRLA